MSTAAVPSTPAAARPAQGRSGSIPRELGGDSVRYLVCMQQHRMSCAAACLAMVAWQNMAHMHMTERDACDIIDSCRQAARAGNGKQRKPVDWNAGINPTYLVEAIQERLHRLVTIIEVGNRLVTTTALCPRTPAILLIEEQDSHDLHAVLVMNQTAKGCIVLDPAVGVVLCEKDEIEGTDYCPFHVVGGKLERLPPAHWGTVKVALLIQ